MRTLTVLSFAATIGFSGMMNTATAHHPDRENQPVRPRVDVIGPVGNNMPTAYRRRFNRPRYWAGKIAYKIAPSSQEAMAWHRAEHHGYYEGEHPRMVTHYFYPKPYEAIKVGSRPAPKQSDENESSKTYSAENQTQGKPALARKTVADDQIASIEPVEASVAIEAEAFRRATSLNPSDLTPITLSESTSN